MSKSDIKALLGRVGFDSAPVPASGSFPDRRSSLSEEGTELVVVPNKDANAVIG